MKPARNVNIKYPRIIVTYLDKRNRFAMSPVEMCLAIAGPPEPLVAISVRRYWISL